MLEKLEIQKQPDVLQPFLLLIQSPFLISRPHFSSFPETIHRCIDNALQNYKRVFCVNMYIRNALSLLCTAFNQLQLQ